MHSTHSLAQSGWTSCGHAQDKLNGDTGNIRVLVQDCLALGVIFAATDSVAVLQVLKQDRSPLLYSLVFGEGVINDATAVALLRAVQVSLPQYDRHMGEDWTSADSLL